MSFRTHAVTLLSTAFLLLYAPVPVRAADDAATATALFDPATLHDVQLWMHGPDWGQLRERYLENTYYPADVQWDGHVIRNVGVRSRGSGSRDPRKPSLKVDFNEFVDGQEFAGLKGFALDNFRQDPAMLKETVSMQLFARMGIAAPRTVHARVHVNGEYLGLFGVVELVDKPFLQRALGEDDGYLYDFEWNGDYHLTWLGPDPNRYAVMFEAQTHEKQPPEQLFGTLVAMITAVNHTSRHAWPRMLEHYFDVERLMTYLAVEAFLSDHDGLAGDWGINNFYLYRHAERERFTFIPWDKDVNFREPDRDVYAGIEANVLLATAFQYAPFHEAYRAALRRCAATAAEIAPGTGNGWLELEIVRQVTMIRAAARADVNKAYTDDRFEQEVAWMLAFARQRGGQVLRQVGGARP